MRVLKIRNGWFRSAGVVYAWRHMYDVLGVGIDLELLRGNDKIQVEVNGVKYILNCREALDFISRYNSVKTIVMNKRIGIVSKSLLKNESSPVHEA